jgi:hypothetical protein
MERLAALFLPLIPRPLPAEAGDFTAKVVGYPTATRSPS